MHSLLLNSDKNYDLVINCRYRGDISIERIMPANAAKFFMDKRMKHMRNIQDNEQMKNQMAQQKIAIEKEKGMQEAESKTIDIYEDLRN